METKKFYVIKTTKDGVQYKRTKYCYDDWVKSPQGCWQFSEQGAKKIAARYNRNTPESMKSKVHYNVLEVGKVMG